MTNYFTSETLSVIGDSVFLGSTVLGAYALIGGDNILMNDEMNTVSLTQDVSINTLKVASILDLSGELRADGGIKCDINKFTVANGTGNTAIAGTLTIGTGGLLIKTNAQGCPDIGLNNNTFVNSSSSSMIFGKNNNFDNTNATQSRIIFGYNNIINGDSDGALIFGRDSTIASAGDGTIFGSNCTVSNASSCALGIGAISDAGSQTIIGSNGYSQALRLQGGLGYINSTNLIVTKNSSNVININGLVSVNSTISNDKAYRTYLNNVETFYVQMNGNIWAQAVTTYSDSRLKHNQEPLQGLELIRKLKPTKYDKTNTENKGDIYIQEAGFIAQEILETDISWAVHTSNTQDQYYGLNYNSVFTYGIQAIKELDEQLHIEKEKTKLLQEQLQKTNEELQKNIFDIQYIKNILEIV